MKYKSSKDTTTLILTFVLSLILIVSCYFSISELLHFHGILSKYFLTLLLLFSLVLFPYLVIPQAYSISENNLIIHRAISNIQYSIQSIDEIKQLNKKEIKKLIRTSFVSSLFGNYGRFYSHKYGSVLFCATKSNNCILISFYDNKKILITPDELSIIDNLLEQKKGCLQEWLKITWS